MGKIAFVFPGQGSQKAGMGRSAFEQCPAAAEVFRIADEALGESISGMCFDGPDTDLALTANTQPAILTVSVALYRALGIVPDVAAGHSLGEWSAHVAMGTLDLADAVRLVRRRGTYMQEAVPVGTGAMAAILKADVELVEGVCAATEGVVEAVNYNAPGQIVIAGAAAAVKAACEALKAQGARPIPLPVSAPFHSSLMRPAEERLAVDLAAITFGTPGRPVIANIDAEPVTDGERARRTLLAQVSGSVRWSSSITRMVDDGVTLFVEVGPGKVLTGLVPRITDGAKAISVQGPEDFDAARVAIDAARLLTH
jgi:[acyl-carrier-protein] S-malonyltransferase